MLTSRQKSARARLAVASFVLAVAGDAGLAATDSEPQVAPRHHIAHRLDGGRVVIVLDRMSVGQRQLREDRGADPSAALPAPAATLSGIGDLWPVDEATLSRYGEKIETDLWRDVDVGDPWMLRAGPSLVFPVRIESFAAARVHCSRRVAVIGRVVDEAGAFAAVRTKYYLAVPEAEFVPGNPRPARHQPALLDWTNSRQRPLGPALEAALREQFDKQLAEYEQRDDRLARFIKRGFPWAKKRQEVLQRHSRGDGDLISELQVVRLGPAGEKRLYVRAQLTLEGKSVFLMSCWVAPGDHRIERVRFRPSERLGTWVSGLRNLPVLLGVFDANGDGWAEVLTGVSGYEGFRMELIEYSETGFRETGIKLAGGC